MSQKKWRLWTNFLLSFFLCSLSKNGFNSFNIPFDIIHKWCISLKKTDIQYSRPGACSLILTCEMWVWNVFTYQLACLFFLDVSFPHFRYASYIFTTRLCLCFVAYCYLSIVFLFVITSFVLRRELPAAAILIHKNLFLNDLTRNYTCVNICVCVWTLLHPSESRTVFITLSRSGAS